MARARAVSWITLVAAVGLAAPARAETPSRTPCVGWAGVGAVAGGFAATWSAIGVFTLAGGDINAPDGEATTFAVVLPAMALGFTFGPMASCAIFGDEGRTVPAATFVIGGSLGGFAAAGVPAFSFLADSEGGASLAAILSVAGGVLGGYVGWRLHRWRLPDDPAGGGVSLAPMIGHDLGGLAVVGRF